MCAATLRKAERNRQKPKHKYIGRYPCEKRRRRLIIAGSSGTATFTNGSAPAAAPADVGSDVAGRELWAAEPSPIPRRSLGDVGTVGQRKSSTTHNRETSMRGQHRESVDLDDEQHVYMDEEDYLDWQCSQSMLDLW